MGVWLVGFAFLMIVAAASFADDVVALKTGPGQVEPSETMSAYLRRLARSALARREVAYEQLKTPEQISAYQQRMREFFLSQLGPLPDKTPLEARVVGRLGRDGYCIEKIIYESQPGVLVTALLYLPMSEPPYPAVLVPCGHSQNGKAADAYQRACILLATNGMAAFCYDPIGQGERYQLLDADGQPRFAATTEHTLVGVGSILLGTNTAGYRIWDGMRAIDYLVARPDIDPERIGCTGISGGGTLTSYLTALDGRIACAAPGCYLTTLGRLIETIGPQDAEQNIHGQIAYGMDHADYVIMAGPRPTLLLAATRDFFDIEGTWQTFRQAKRIYTRLGYPERVELTEADADHGFSKPLRQSMVRWMRRWLLGKDEPIVEPDLEILTDEQLRCSPRGQVMLMPGARSVFDLNVELDRRFSRDRARVWGAAAGSDALEQVRRIARIARLEDLPEPEVKVGGAVRRNGYRIEKLLLSPEARVPLSALVFEPSAPDDQTHLYLHGAGYDAAAGAGGPIEKLVLQGHRVLAVDLSGIGQGGGEDEQSEWQEYFGPDYNEVALAYLLDRSYLGMRAEDVLVCARFLAGYRAAEKPNRVHLIAVGQVGPPALHAAALEPQLFASLRLEETLVSWSRLVNAPAAKNQLVNVVHAALRVYDLPDLLATLSQGMVVVVNPFDPAGGSVGPGG